jgi:hypothetical protein
MSGFSLKLCEWSVEWNERFKEQLRAAGVELPEHYESPRGSFDCAQMVPVGRKVSFRFRWSRAQAVAHLAEIHVPGFNGSWADFHFAVPCEGAFGEDQVLRCVVRN